MIVASQAPILIQFVTCSLKVMAPEIDTINWSKERVDAYNLWVHRVAEAGRARGKKRVTDEGGRIVQFVLIDDEPVTEYLDNLLVHREHKISFSSHLAEELEKDGIITETDIVKPAEVV